MLVESPSCSSPLMGLSWLFVSGVHDTLSKQFVAILPSLGERLDSASPCFQIAHCTVVRLETQRATGSLASFSQQRFFQVVCWNKLLRNPNCLSQVRNDVPFYTVSARQATRFTMKFTMKFRCIPKYPSYKLVQFFIHFVTLLFTKKVPMYLCTT